MKRYRLALFAIQWMIVFIIGLETAWAGTMPSGRVSDIQNTKHNFSSSTPPDILGNGDTRTVRASEEAEICVFCHTPHGANVAAPGPLWNRSLSTATYDTYNSGSLDATGEGIALDQPGGISKLCLSCHDGTIAIGSVRNRSGSDGFQASAVGMTGVEADGTMPGGLHGENSGFTRRLGTDLTNDHPISFTYDTALANRDGEMRDPAIEAHIGNRSPGNSPHIPLEDGQVQCNSCHDPHIRDATDPTRNIKFLRLNRFQRVSPTNTTFNEANDIICMACHDKDGWVGSAHATDIVANEIYTDAAADRHEFPRGSAVWETACLTCHDTHTVQGSRRLLREGVDGPVGASGAKQGGDAAIEETCYACHSNDGGTLTAQGINTEVPDIKTDFSLPRHMPIANSEQVAGREMHDIGTVGTDSQEITQRGKDFIESQASLGKVSAGGSLANRHVECTDCHNPHRVVRRRLFTENHLTGVLDSAGTHAHDISDITAETPHTTHNNLASGVLRGAWGVEPVYGSNNFAAEPVDFIIKRGDPGTPGYGSGTTDVTEPYMTREYQICLKCHSNYAYDTPPMLGASPATTPPGTNGMFQYTNQAQEFNAPISHRGEGQPLGVDGGAGTAPAGSDWNTNNHRGWHPVMQETGRDPATRKASANNWIAPFNAAVGTQTMYCSDCHGSNTPPGTADPDGPGYENGAAWGPHGSTNDFLLKGPWSSITGNAFSPNTENHLCFKCHEFDQYANINPPVTQDSGFGSRAMCMGCGGGPSTKNYHVFHAAVVVNFRCNLCHVAVPHGWKNKAFLVNLNDVGPEAGFLGPGNQVRYDTSGLGFPVGAYTQGPYYNRAALKIISFARSGEWTESDCGSSGAPGNGVRGIDWMIGVPGISPDGFSIIGGEGCDNLP